MLSAAEHVATNILPKLILVQETKESSPPRKSQKSHYQNRLTITQIPKPRSITAKKASKLCKNNQTSKQVNNDTMHAIIFPQKLNIKQPPKLELGQNICRNPLFQSNG